MAEEIKYVEEAPESQPSVREKLAWVPGYPRDRLDEFLDNIALLVRQAREQASLAETRAAQATLEAYNAAGARQAAEASALEGLGYKQSASKSAGDSATEADRSSDEADRAKEEADRVLHDLAVHTGNPEAHPQYIKAALPLGTTAEQQFAWTLEGWRSVVSGDKVRCFAPASSAVPGSLQLNEALGWNDPVLAEDGDYIMLYTDLVGGPERQSPLVKSGGWWFVSTREISSDYFVQTMYSDYGDTCTRSFTVSPGESGPVVEGGDGWQILAKADFYYTERFQNANRATTGRPTVRKIVQGDLAYNALYHTNSAIKAFELPSGNVDGFVWYAGGGWFTVTNMTAEPVNITGVESTVINGVMGLASEVEAESNHMVVVPPWCTAKIRSLYPNNWIVTVEQASAGSSEPVNKPPVFLDNTTVTISNYSKHRIMRPGPEAEGTPLAFTLPTDAEGWIEFSIDHAWETDEFGKLKTPLVLVASGSDLISTNDGKYPAVKFLYRNDLTTFRRGVEWHINDCEEYVLPPSQVISGSIEWTAHANTTNDLMQNVKQVPTLPEDGMWWVSWSNQHYRLYKEDPNGGNYLTWDRTIVLIKGFADRGIFTPVLKCLTVGWDSATSKPVFYAIVETSSGLSGTLTVGHLDFATGVITWTLIEGADGSFQSIEVTNNGWVIAIAGFYDYINELTYHPTLQPLRKITTYQYTSLTSSNHRWDFSTVIRGAAGGTKTAYMLDDEPVTFYRPTTDKVVFATTDGVAVVTYSVPASGTNLERTYSEKVVASPYGPFQAFMFDPYRNRLCFSSDSEPALLWYRDLTRDLDSTVPFEAGNGKYGIRFVGFDWGDYDGGQPMFAAMVGDDIIVGLSPSWDQYRYHTFGLYPTVGGVRVPSYIGNDALTVPAFGATRQFNPDRAGGNGDRVYMRFHYRYKTTGISKYVTYLGSDPGAFWEAKIPDVNNE